MEKDSLTALDFLESQLQLEREARELMPYEPDTCTYPKVLRQQVFACLTCLGENGGLEMGVCYLCLIQCHSTHDIVELFSKRNFVCDCGTKKAENSRACALRYGKLLEKPTKKPRMRTGSDSGSGSFLFPKVDLPLAEDIPSLENLYNHNFKGRFCSCKMIYHAELETRTMHQCFFGEACGEDWFHQDCILGFELKGEDDVKKEEVNEELKEETKETMKEEVKEEAKEEDKDEEIVVPYFPSMDDFLEFICWKCTSLYPEAFEQLAERDEITFTKLPHFPNLKSPEHWKCRQDALDEQPQKKQKLDSAGNANEENLALTLYSIFLRDNFREKLTDLLKTLQHDSPLYKLLQNHTYLFEEDPIYEPVEETELAPGGNSLFELGSSALLSLPAPHALEGLQAYDTMKKKLSTFFKDFVDNNKVVTEKEVKDFFGKMKEEQ